MAMVTLTLQRVDLTLVRHQQLEPAQTDAHIRIYP